MKLLLLLICRFVIFITVNYVDVGAMPSLVGFTYGQTSHVNVSDGSILTFDKEITSVGTDGKLTSGQFICYVDGLYKFQIYALTKNDTKIWLELYKNNDLVVSVYTHTIGDYADCGNAAILELTTGDTVFIKARDQYNVILYGTTDEIYTTFTGVYLGDSFLDEVGLTPAFSVAVNKNTYVSGNSNVIYTKIITDIANMYDNRTGVVPIEIPGIYIIHFYSVSSQNQKIYQELYHNKDFVCALYNYADNEWSTAGNTAILHLKTGDTVSVSAASGYYNNIFGKTDEVYSTFSGALIATEDDLNNKGSTVVAFTAGLSRDITVTGGQKVIFDQIILDLNRVYDQTTGDFSAPIGGTYEFIFHALGQIDEAIWLELYKNYQYIDSLYSHNPTHYASGGNTAVLQLDAGDVVYVKARMGNDNLLYGRGDEIYCTFSGYLIHPAANLGTVIG